ncbi:MMPL family transporter [Aestuariirhabdus sp. LZHN29]|uniref:MMPL family transporter n=1 Tax=Aestuariirhabdus sp. LZHN29 TaxID=3417462 RepID=UPI003CEBD059
MEPAFSPLLAPRWQPVRLIAWALLMLALVWQATLLLANGFHPRTSMLELLPQAEQQPAVQQALDRFSSRLSRQLLFVVEADERDSARQSAQALARELVNSALLSELSLTTDPQQQQAMGALYYHHRNRLLSPGDRHLLTNGDSSLLRERALQDLYSPFSGVTAEQFDSDPFGLFRRYLESIQPQNGSLQLDDGMLVQRTDERYSVLLRATLNSDPFDLGTQRQLINLLDRFRGDQPATTELLYSGALFYAAAGADSAREEISTIGLGSLCGVLLLILWVFRSFSPLFIATLSIGSGVVTGLVVTLLLFGQIHLFTLVIGACLIGVSIDYAFHYFAEQHQGGSHWQPLQGLGRILAAITMGLISSLLGYSALLATPFPGLQQLAVFSCSGLLLAWLTVVLLYPSLLRPLARNPGSGLLPLYRPLIRFWQHTSTRRQITMLALLGLIALTGVLRIETNDDVRQLQPLNAGVQSMEKKIKAMTGSQYDHSFLLVTAPDNEALLQKEEQFYAHIKSKNDNISHLLKRVSAQIPSIKTQSDNLSLIKNLKKSELEILLNFIGYKEQDNPSHNQNMTNANFLSIEKIIKNDLQYSLNHQWLDNTPHGVASIILFKPEIHQTIKALSKDLPGIRFISQADDTSEILARYRYRISWLLAAAYLAIFVILRLRYPLIQAVAVITVPLLASSLALGIHGLSGQPINLFHLLALLLLLGISIDYGVFFAERGDQWRTTLLGVTLAALTTLLSFGLLSLSATPAISAFGQTLLVGILVAYLLAPFASKRGLLP